MVHDLSKGCVHSRSKANRLDAPRSEHPCGVAIGPDCAKDNTMVFVLYLFHGPRLGPILGPVLVNKSKAPWAGFLWF